MQIIAELEGYRRGPYAGAVGYATARTGRSTCASRSARSSSTTASPLQAGARDRRRLRPGGGAPRSACTSSPRSRPRSTSRRRSADDPPRRQLRLVHLQPRPPLRRARGGGGRAAERRDRRRRGERARAVAPRHLARARAPGGRGRVAGDHPRGSPADDADARRLPRPPGDRRGVRRRGRPARELVHGKATAVTTTGAASSPGCPTASRPAATTRSPRSRPGRARGLRDRRGRRGDGRAAPRAARRRRPVPSRVGADARRAGRSRGTSWRAR